MPIKLNGSTSGYSQINAAAVAASNTLTLPSATATLICSDGDSYLATTTGNVGIGTSSPEAKTSIVSSAGAIGLTIKDTNAGASNYFSAQYNGTSGVADIKAQSSGGSTQIAFSTSLSGATAERMRIDSSGNLQVGGTTVANTAGYVNSRTNTRAWARWTGSTVAIASSYNVSSITRSSAGQYVVNFTTALADANYAPMMSCSGDVSYNGYGIFTGMTSAPTTSSFAMWTKAYNGTAADANVVQIAVFGN